MASPRRDLIAALRETAGRLAADGSYQWGHMGMCNCGHLAQSITGLRQAEIHDSALVREGDWEQQAKDYCPTSGQLIDSILATMFDLGLTRGDIRHLEKLSDPAVIRRVGRHLKFNRREDVVTYLVAWADLLCNAADMRGTTTTGGQHEALSLRDTPSPLDVRIR